MDDYAAGHGAVIRRMRKFLQAIRALGYDARKARYEQAIADFTAAIELEPKGAAAELQHAGFYPRHGN